MNNFIPVKVTTYNQEAIWYLDTSKLGLTDLRNLRNELIGNDDYGVKKIDSVITHELGYDSSRLSQNRPNIRVRARKIPHYQRNKSNEIHI